MTSIASSSSGQKPQAYFQLSPEKAREQDALKARLQQTVDALKQSRIDVAGQRKSMAAQRVTQLKDAIKAMRQMPGMDPQAVSGMIARMSRDLSSAVKDYAQASGDIAGSDAPTPATPPAAEQNSAFASGVKLYAAVQGYAPAAPAQDDEDKAFVTGAKDIAHTLKALADFQKRRQDVQGGGGIFRLFSPLQRDMRSIDNALSRVSDDLANLTG